MATLEGVNKQNFQITTRSWRLLADLIFDRCGDLIKENEREGWHSNYGKMISRKTAIAIADRLGGLIRKGIVKRYESELEVVNMQFHFSEKIVDKFIEFCRQSGGFDIY